MLASTPPAMSLLTYCHLPYNGKGPMQSCISILEHVPATQLSTLLFMPRFTKRPPDSIKVTQSLAMPLRRLPWRYVGGMGRRALDRAFARGIDRADPRSTIVYLWPDHPTWILTRAKMRGLMTVREMINSYRGSAKRILDEAYERLDLRPTHGITDESVAIEKQQLALYDFVFASNQVEPTLREAGVEGARILPTSFGWDPRRFTDQAIVERPDIFTALFVGTVSVRKGVIQMLEAWRRSGVKGVLKIVGGVSPDLEPLLQPFRADPSIQFIGFSGQVGGLYRAADVFIFPSFEEGGPQVVYEAAGCGLPVIATPMGAGRMVRDGLNGLIVQPYDVEGLARTIHDMASSPARRRLLGKQAQADAAAFTYQKIGEERTRMLLSALRRHTGAADA
jgi:glycosyltransferase involved in cell wall biosynthesis